MGKRFKGKTCVYCGGEGLAQLGDHVFARELLPVAHRANLPQVASCDPCNTHKGRLEHYLLTVLPFGSNHPEASALFQEATPRRLARNVKLHRELAAGRVPAVVVQAGVHHSTLAVPFDGEKLVALFKLITRGMVAHEWNVLAPQSHWVGAGILTAAGEAITVPLLELSARARVVGSLGDGLIEYEGAQAVDDAALTIWRYRLYGGLMFADEEKANAQATANIWALTAKQPLPGLFDGQ